MRLDGLLDIIVRPTLAAIPVLSSFHLLQGVPCGEDDSDRGGVDCNMTTTTKKKCRDKDAGCSLCLRSTGEDEPSSCRLGARQQG